MKSFCREFYHKFQFGSGARRKFDTIFPIGNTISFYEYNIFCEEFEGFDYHEDFDNAVGGGLVALRV